MGNGKRVPIVFVSYSHESEAHRERVKDFVVRLRKEAGCDTRFDRMQPPVADWKKWIERAIEQADVVLMVFTERYRSWFDGSVSRTRGRGVAWEGRIITNMLYSAAGAVDAAKFIPVVFDPADKAYIPRNIFSGTEYLLPNEWDALLRGVWGEPEVSPPPVGRRPTARKRKATSRVRKASTRRKTAAQLEVMFVGCERGTGLNIRGQLAHTRRAIASTNYGRRVKLVPLFDPTPLRFQAELGKQSPQVLHLSGRQVGGQVRMHDEFGELAPIAADRLAELIRLTAPSLQLVILDTCYSLPQAKELVKHLDAAIGVESGIAEPVAIDFFASFYTALGNGASLERAFDCATSIQLSRIEGDTRYRTDIEEIVGETFDRDLHLPKLVVRRGARVNRLVPLEDAAAED